ncbi:Rod binding protein [Tranquillimonas rosea]|uniref:Rod binding protein n=2 Tax=Tranquillimonas rosea TaxID=641238 RepID=A0A1H9X506_9RHOB|nr:rod-binding protein [Tranquillimonas rosea]SES41235.1 Rod binding protein [Tranquillimonas rosea]
MLIQSVPPALAPTANAAQPLRAAATELESVFLAEMLKATGLNETPDTFGGGAGEDQFASYLRRAQADSIAAAGGIGLAEHIFRSLAGAPDGA